MFITPYFVLRLANSYNNFLLPVNSQSIGQETRNLTFPSEV